MQLNTLQPAPYSKKKAVRVGRGIGSGIGKTCGRGVKGQKARSGGYHKVGFEGGQMPIQRRLGKFGFTSRKRLVSTEIRLSALNTVEAEVIDIVALHQANLITADTKFVKIFASGTITKAVTIKGIPVTKGAAAAIQAAGGRIE
jgi:large subunit ribosomal protein L15